MEFPPPLDTYSIRLEWTLERDCYYNGEGRPDRLILRFAPAAPGLFAPAGRDLVLDPLALVESLRRPGGYFLLTCSCGIADDLDIKTPVFVSHPDTETVLWELDVPGLAPALDERWRGWEGFLRLVFRRDAYRESILGMLQAARSADGTELPVEALEPDHHGDAWERCMALDAASLSQIPEPVLPAGSQLEVAMSGANIFFLDGRPLAGWPTRLFTRWAVNAAFETWMSFVMRGFALAYGEPAFRPVTGVRRNDFFLLRADRRADFDQAGEVLAARLGASFAEGRTAPGVTVRFRPGPVCSAGD